MFCVCDLNLRLGIDYIDDDDNNADDDDDDDTDCIEAMLLAHLHLSLCSNHGSGSQMGGVANGGHLLGLIAFARKIARVLLSLSLLCCILFLSFYLGSNYDGPVGVPDPSPHARTTGALLVNSPDTTTTSTTITTIDPSAVNLPKMLTES